jgi:hypothetical protein
MAPIAQSGILSQDGFATTQEALPNIIVARYHTQTISTSSYFLEAQHLPWADFENEVRQKFLSMTWGKSIISVRRAVPDQLDIVNEMFQCGDELSVSGRFVQQVLHVMTAVAKDGNIPIRFGDFRTVYTPEREKMALAEEKRAGSAQTSQPSQPLSEIEDSQTGENRKGEDPDFAAVDFNNRVRFVGEIKTPWTQNFTKTQQNDPRWRRWIGKCSASVCCL